MTKQATFSNQKIKFLQNINKFSYPHEHLDFVKKRFSKLKQIVECSSMKKLFRQSKGSSADDGANDDSQEIILLLPK